MDFDLQIETLRQRDAVFNPVGRVTVTGRVLLDGAEVPIDWPIIIVNPPELVPDGDGSRRDPEEAVRLIVLDVARAAVS